MTWNDLPDTARLWVYTADRQLLPDEVAQVNAALASFVSTWTAHRQGLRAFADVVQQRFVRIAVDQSQTGASGCSIDASVRFLEGLGQRLGVNFFERLVFFADDGEGFRAFPRDVFAAAYAKGELNDGSPVIDPLVDTKASYDLAFVKPLSISWHARMV